MNGITFIADEINENGNELVIDTTTEFASFRICTFANKLLLVDFAGQVEVFSKLHAPSTLNFQFGQFGSAAAGGAARLSFQYLEREGILVGMGIESPYRKFGGLEIADSATLTFRTELVLFDNFIVALNNFVTGRVNTAILERV